MGGSNAIRGLGNVLTCQELNQVAIVETGCRETAARDRRKPQLTPRLMDYGREMATQGLKPARISMGMPRLFGPAEAEMRTLRQVQWFGSNFPKTNLHSNDGYEDILDQIDQLVFGPATTDTQPFSFGLDRDGKDNPDMGNGSDEHPCFVGLTTKVLLCYSDRDPNSFVFHLDGTFKLNQVAYPVIICGVSDCSRSFFLGAVFIVSQRLEGIYVQALTALRKI
ncbi:hypothetical protein PHYSODRAFT_504509 [Phytophthora sojae]|uniref:MULE transposase domain-containing protein n=1 Tax=Phytophthora sojae (strain P6497) TaxID=1094619 RepID=G4ZHE1_PHYSP|nr:hypothetical protein PHYSODRAFT_504509 [Phytophthora sojae]EGZ17611.1 hypothetical protein PHYSODRAFT_504509 [Phytophthora sojae]|eukprot:XP_009526669.1 hypothetical protein PHYSODRAFT_504509 [Phytophthora sojae]